MTADERLVSLVVAIAAMREEMEDNAAAEFLGLQIADRLDHILRDALMLGDQQ